MNTFNNRPIFLLNVDDDYSTITTISLVTAPAMELPMFCFSDDKKLVFSLQDEVKHNILTCIVRCDYPILRMSEDGNPYYVMFNKETSEKLCQKLLTDGFQQHISLDHNGELIEGIQLQEVFLKDTSKGISPVGFEDAAEGSMFGIYHITDDNLWKDCVEGRFGGVSLESYFRLENFNKINNKKKNMMSKIKEKLKSLLMEFNSLSTDKADLYWDEDAELEVGMKVFVDKDGERVPAEDGEYISDENKIKVEGGVVTEIEKKEAEPEPKADPAEPKEGEIKKEGEQAMEEPAQEPAEPAEPANEEPKVEDKVAELEKKVADMEAQVAEVIAKLAELAQKPAAEPVMDEFEAATMKGKTGNDKFDKLKAAFSEINK